MLFLLFKWNHYINIMLVIILFPLYIIDTKMSSGNYKQRLPFWFLAPWHINYIFWLLRVLGITQIGFTSKNQIGAFIHFIILYYDTHKNKQFKCYFICLLSFSVIAMKTRNNHTDPCAGNSHIILILAW